eukprot:TRINITY_DN5258_c2_g1_i1.p1 TRINITY_DN5258_c2_g1~~TRINITY_DN5258_c2_g1_i1.p1  ORF type:complete len:395 (-),score=67.82 TRINITY_DN5258_c2_g1_i1:21-1205(-)
MQYSALILLFLVCQSMAVVVVPFYGNFSNLPFYYTTVSVGTPPLTYSVILDTGSSDFLVPNWGCEDCAGDPSNFYSAQNSSTSTVISCKNNDYKCQNCSATQQCVYNVDYVGISETVQLTSDIAIIGKNVVVPHSFFGAITNISMSQKKRVSKFGQYQDDFYPEGVWGLSYRVLSAGGAPTLFDALTKALNIPKIFSFCVNKDGINGAISFGGVLPKSKDISYTAITHEDFYSIEMKDISINGQSLGLAPPVYNTKHCIVDSGTPQVTLPPSVFQAIETVFKQNCTKSNLHGVCDAPAGKTLFDGACFTFTPEQMAQLPTFTFIFGGGLPLVYHPAAYLQPWYTCQEHGALALMISPDSSGFGSVVGMSALQSYISVYDVENKRFGLGTNYGCE